MYAIETKNLTVRFGGTVAVDGVSLALEPGSSTACLGAMERGRQGAG